MATDVDVPDPGFSKRLWAAYVLGRYPHALMAWHEAFFIDPREISPKGPMPEALNAPLDEIPDLYLDLDDAVRELALAHEIDPYHHVEIRNSLYRSEEASRELLNRDQRNSSRGFNFGNRVLQPETPVFPDRIVASGCIAKPRHPIVEATGRSYRRVDGDIEHHRPRSDAALAGRG